MRAAMYARLSTSDQNLALQIRELRAYTEHQGWDISEVYRDLMSGAKTIRPALNRRLDPSQFQAQLAQASRSQVSQAQVRAAQGKAAVDVAQVNLNHTVIEALTDGVVVARNVDVGQTKSRCCKTAAINCSEAS